MKMSDGPQVEHLYFNYLVDYRLIRDALILKFKKFKLKNSGNF